MHRNERLMKNINKIIEMSREAMFPSMDKYEYVNPRRLNRLARQIKTDLLNKE